MKCFLKPERNDDRTEAHAKNAVTKGSRDKHCELGYFAVIITSIQHTTITNLSKGECEQTQ